MNFVLNSIYSLSIGFAAIIGAWRFGVIHPVFRPFIYLCWIAFINEVFSLVMIRIIHNNAVNSNIYVLVEALLIVWQFFEWNLFRKNKIIFSILFISLIAIWVTEDFIISSIMHFSSWFRIFYSFITVLLAIILLNRQLINNGTVLLKNPVALICIGFIIYYTYKILVETFWVYGLNENAMFRNNVYIILSYINLFSNLIYALAILWMPTKHRFTLQY